MILPLNNDIFKKRAVKIHGNKYDYSLVDYKNTKQQVKIICKKHGIFNQTPRDHLTGCGCSVCNISKIELKIKDYFDKNNIEYIWHWKDHNCLSPLNNKLEFDFYLPNRNIIIEYDGEFHFGKVRFNFNYKRIREYDEIKDNWCKENNKRIIRIPYTEKNNIIKILEKI